MRNGGQVMDIQRICEELSDRWPEWSERISLLQFREADGLGAAANDGRSVIYNDRLMSYYTQEHQSFYVAQQIMHLQLNHFARGRGRTLFILRTRRSRAQRGSTRCSLRTPSRTMKRNR